MKHKDLRALIIILAVLGAAIYFKEARAKKARELAAKEAKEHHRHHLL